MIWTQRLEFIWRAAVRHEISPAAWPAIPSVITHVRCGGLILRFWFCSSPCLPRWYAKAGLCPITYWTRRLPETRHRHALRTLLHTARPDVPRRRKLQVSGNVFSCLWHCETACINTALPLKQLHWMQFKARPGRWWALLPHSRKAAGSFLALGSFGVDFAGSPLCLCGFLPQPIHVGNSKLTLGVCEEGIVSVCFLCSLRQVHRYIYLRAYRCLPIVCST